MSLINGWLPLAIHVAAALLLLTAVGWRSRRWRVLLLPIAIVLGSAVGGAAWWYSQFEGIANDVPPISLWVWIGLSGISLAVALLGFRSASWRRRSASAVAVFMCVLSAAAVLNSWVGYWPTARIAWNALAGVPLPHEIDAATLRAMQRSREVPAHGTIVAFESGSAGSRMSHRDEYVYLPPAWYSTFPPPRLPAVLVLGGEFAKPTDWLLSGNLFAKIDNFASVHNGFSPIFVFADATGFFRNDTECVNGTRGNSADHLTNDVVPAVIRQFGAVAIARTGG